MNCRPGDLAVIVRATDEYETGWVGRLVKVTTLSGTGPDGIHQCWSYEGPALHHALYGACLGIADIVLRPIRPQDDDADCESKAWLPPVPHEVTA